MTETNFEKYDNPTMLGVIVSTKMTTIRDYIDAKYHDKFEELDRDIFVISYDFKETDKTVSKDWFCTVPKMTGYNKSNLKALRDKNPDLKALDTEDWVGKTIHLTLDSKGYLTVAL